MNIILTCFHCVISTLKRKIIAKLKFPLFCLLRNIAIGASLHRWKEKVWLRSHAKDIILEVLKLKYELIQFRSAKCVVMIGDKTVKFVGVCVSASQIRRLCRIYLIVWRVIFFGMRNDRTSSVCR